MSFDLCTVVKGHKYEYTHHAQAESKENLTNIPANERGRAIRPITEADIRQVAAAASALRKTKSIVPFISERSIRRTSLSERLLFYKMRKGSRFLDTIRIKCVGGTGGNGRLGFGHPGRSGFGKPNGGNGGPGGNVYLKTDPNISSYFRIARNVRAENGQNGGQNMCTGRAGKDIIIRVPVGTLISLLRFEDANRPQSLASQASADHALNTILSSSDINAVARDGISSLSKIMKKKSIEYEASRLSLIAQIDMERPKMLVKVASGGRGGLGNKDLGKFPPNETEAGYLGSSVFLQLDLKTIADVGLVGMPNAGKSSILASLTNARPRISPVPFTTLHPNLGVLQPANENYQDMPLKIADLPGLVEGAHLNIGLGHAFLKHVYRSKVIAYVVDICSKDPFQDFEVIRNELKSYDASLLDRPSIVVLNKTDLKTSTAVNLPIFMDKMALHPDVKVRQLQVVLFSAKDVIVGQSKDELKNSLLQVLCDKIGARQTLPQNNDLDLRLLK